MPAQKLDKETRKAILEARSMIETISKNDANEAETCRRIEHFFDTLMHYDIFAHITKEHSIHSVGDSDYCDFAIQMEKGDKITPIILVEVKRVNMELSPKHLKQATSYAINIGCEWAILTNARDWQLYHVSFGQPPQTTLLDSWHLMTDNVFLLSDKFDLIGLKNVKRGGLEQLWQKSNVLTPRNVLKVILSEPSISMIKRELKKGAGIALSPEEIVGAVRHLLNESAVAELEGIKITLSAKPKVITKPTTAEISAGTQASGGDSSRTSEP